MTTPPEQHSLTHLDEQGRARMVDVGEKDVTHRVATARGHVSIQPETARLIREGLLKKGDVLTIAQVAGIMGSKKTSELIPLCHPLPIDKVDVDLQLDDRPHQHHRHGQHHCPHRRRDGGHDRRFRRRPHPL